MKNRTEKTIDDFASHVANGFMKQIGKKTKPKYKKGSVSVWHDVTEKPKHFNCDENHSAEILYTGKKGTHSFCAGEVIWNYHLNRGEITKWAYVKDLLKL